MNTKSKLAGIALIAATAFSGCKETPAQPPKTYNVEGNQITWIKENHVCDRRVTGDYLIITGQNGIANKINSCGGRVYHVVITGINPEIDTNKFPPYFSKPIIDEAQKRRDQYVSKFSEQATQKLQ